VATTETHIIAEMTDHTKKMTIETTEGDDDVEASIAAAAGMRDMCE
jgi:hypothetical protein